MLGEPYIVLPNCHDLIFGHPDTTGTFNVRQWSVSHHLAGHLAYRGVSISFVSRMLRVRMYRKITS